MVAHIGKKRKQLSIDKARERVLMDMAGRRDMEAPKSIMSQKFHNLLESRRFLACPSATNVKALILVK